jgi:transcriptional regulator with XRE-family HTH domain
VKEIKSRGRFNLEDYKKRLKLLREIYAGDNQQEFAERIGIPFKRWNNYERGYPIPRETAFILMEELGVSVEWLWYGMTGNLTKSFTLKLEEAEKAKREYDIAVRKLTKAKETVAEKEAKRRKPV